MERLRRILNISSAPEAVPTNPIILQEQQIFGDQQIEPVAPADALKQVTQATDNDLLDLTSHRLKFWPGFDEYANEWNKHVLSSERQSLIQELATKTHSEEE